MTQSSRDLKRLEWSERIERFQHSGQTVTLFCAGEGVSVPSFYQWRRKLRPESKTLTKAPPKFLPVKLPLDQPADTRAVVSIDLPGGVRVRLEVPGADRSP